MNDRGQVAGVSFTNATPNVATGLPTADPLLWDTGTMRDLGTLGGTFGVPNWMNSRGDIVGQSNLAGDQTFHPFLWDGHVLQDLGTLGGSFGSATWVNDSGDVVGWASEPGDQTNHAVLRRHGARRDLGVPPGDTFSSANAINAQGQIVGNTATCGTSGCTNGTFLWDHGQMSDLQTLVAPTDLHLSEAAYINDRGEIFCVATLPTGDTRIVLLVPAALAASEGLTSNVPGPSMDDTAAVTPARLARCTPVPPWRVRLAHRPHLPCLGM